ncbi:CBASS cGAMP-activated phospholipase [Fischerella sp. PCC 9605]|uniref:CBASS cGAMP-activated phospholipase n=1 Tax=Fischerella sp. PCC 9605 TaxID=1173024 RepID=UPI00047A4A95|nr:CBASS cGAMP-activated phospholipase [Fischerella sp. PCC 9605]
MSFRILSLDGGGIRGLVAAKMLAAIEKQILQPLNEYFNLIAGTSTGSILATAIATGRSSEEIVELYKQKSSIIFPYRSRFSLKRIPLIIKYGLSAPKYSNDGLIQVLKETFGETRLFDVPSPLLLIVSYDTITREPIIFKSWRQDKDYGNVPLWEVCVCSTSAPTYFPAYKLQRKVNRTIQQANSECIYSAIDGGVAANNPSASAVAEALRLGHAADKITVLSIGTGDRTRIIPFEKAESWGLIQWAQPLIGVLFDASSDIYEYITNQIMDNHVLRLQFKLDRQLTGKRLSDDIDDVSEENINNLIEAAEVYINQPQIQAALQEFLRVSH